MSAYGDMKSAPRPILAYLPEQVLVSESFGNAIIDYAREENMEQCRAMLNSEIRAGGSYPFEDELDEAGFKAYFCSHDAFVVRVEQTVVGMFYIKPNFPGRCSHICNGGFVVAEMYRRRGIARFMGVRFQKMAHELGYSASFFNLVFVSNAGSVALWRSLPGFVETGRVPKAGRLKGHAELVDALQIYCDLDASAQLRAAAE